MPWVGFDASTPWAGPVALEPNHTVFERLEFGKAAAPAKITALLDGLAGGSDPQPVRGILYGPGGVLVAVSQEVLVPAGRQPTWTDLNFGPYNFPQLEAGGFSAGVIAGEPGTARIWTVTTGSRFSDSDFYGRTTTSTTSTVVLPAGTIHVASAAGFDSAGTVMVAGKPVTYQRRSDTELLECEGGSGSIPSGTPVTQEGAATYAATAEFASYPLGLPGARLGFLELGTAGTSEVGTAGGLSLFVTYVVVGALERRFPLLTDLEIARLPFGAAQTALETTPVVDTSVLARAGWHGTALDRERGSFAIVNRGGKLKQMVGKRVSVSTFSGKSVIAVVSGEASMEDDISLTRRSFMEIGPLALESVGVKVQELS